MGGSMCSTRWSCTRAGSAAAWGSGFFAEEKARAEGCLSLRLDAVQGNEPAERLYRRCGYQYVGAASLGYEAYGLPWFELYEKML